MEKPVGRKVVFVKNIFDVTVLFSKVKLAMKSKRLKKQVVDGKNMKKKLLGRAKRTR